VRYLGTAVGGPEHTVERWLLTELKGARIFAAQTGYLTEHGLKLIRPHLEAILDEGGRSTSSPAPGRSRSRLPKRPDDRGRLGPTRPADA